MKRNSEHCTILKINNDELSICTQKRMSQLSETLLHSNEVAQTKSPATKRQFPFEEHQQAPAEKSPSHMHKSARTDLETPEASSLKSPTPETPCPEFVLSCIFPECDKTFKKRSKHFYERHMPQWLRYKPENPERWAYMFRFILDCLELSSLLDLLEYVRLAKLEQHIDPLTLQKRDTDIIHMFATFLDIPLHSSYQANEVKCISMLIHWRVLQQIMLTLTEEHRRAILKSKMPKPVPKVHKMVAKQKQKSSDASSSKQGVKTRNKENIRISEHSKPKFKRKENMKQGVQVQSAKTNKPDKVQKNAKKMKLKEERFKLLKLKRKSKQTQSPSLSKSPKDTKDGSTSVDNNTEKSKLNKPVIKSDISSESSTNKEDHKNSMQTTKQKLYKNPKRRRKSKASNQKVKSLSNKKQTDTDPGELSGNWKAMRELICQPSKTKRKAPEKEQGDKKKRPRPDEAKSDDNVSEKSIPDIWFSGVDPSLLGLTSPLAKKSKKPTKKSEESSEKVTDEQADDVSGKLVKQFSTKSLTHAVAMDCEMVGVSWEGKDSILARVSIVNQFGHCVYDTFVKPREEVTDYRTFVSGVRESDLQNGQEFRVVQEKVAEILKGRVLVGHAIHNDLKVLYLSHPHSMIRDTQLYKPFRKLLPGGRPALRKLCDKVLGVQVQKGEHSSVQDAQATMRLYTIYKKQWEKELKDQRAGVKPKDGEATDEKRKKSNRHRNRKMLKKTRTVNKGYIIT